MGNQLCEATQQKDYKNRIMEICNGVDDKQVKIKLEPITFSDNGSPRQKVYRDDQIKESSIDHFQNTKSSLQPMLKHDHEVSSFNTDPIKQPSELHKHQKTSGYSSEYLSQSPARKAKINLQQVYLKHVNSNHEQGNLNYQPIPVPFSVIKMVLDKNLLAHIKEEKQNFLKKYSNDQSSFKLYKEGCYGTLLAQNNGIFLNKDYFYEGGFVVKDSGEFLPHQKGTYITSGGKYVGEFRGGKPHGKGKYIMYHNQDKNKSTIYQGEWENGQLNTGTIQNHLFRYEGALKNRKPHGLGKIVMKVSKSSYKGEFKDGKFHGQKAFYETSEYTYSGDFQNGKKHGRGVLSQKSSALQIFNRKTRVEERYEGRWKEDRLEERIVVSTNS